MIKTQNKKYIGECIYCGSLDGLQDEHCIPQSLNGTTILEKASCPKCAVITSKFEQKFARDSILGFRTVQNMKSKRPKKKRPTEFPMEFSINGNFEEINVPVEEYIPILPLLELGPPEYLQDEITHAEGLQNREFRVEPYTIVHLRGEGRELPVLRKYGADEVRIPYTIHIEDFLRMLAKIADRKSVV